MCVSSSCSRETCGAAGACARRPAPPTAASTTATLSVVRRQAVDLNMAVTSKSAIRWSAYSGLADQRIQSYAACNVVVYYGSTLPDAPRLLRTLTPRQRRDRARRCARGIRHRRPPPSRAAALATPELVLPLRRRRGPERRVRSGAGSDRAAGTADPLGTRHRQERGDARRRP